LAGVINNYTRLSIRRHVRLNEAATCIVKLLFFKGTVYEDQILYRSPR